jgi:hypothetical protein
MGRNSESELPERLDDTDILYAYDVKPDDLVWKELILDLGVPLETQWSLSVGVSYGRSTEEPLQYQVIESISIIMDNEYLGHEYNAEIDRVQPLYIARTRSFYFDHRPTRDEVPPLSPIIPEIPCLESKHKRFKRWEPGDPPLGTMAFYCPGDTFEEVMHSLQYVHCGYVCSRYWASGKNPSSKRNRRNRGPKFSTEEYRAKFMAVVRGLARSNSQMTPNIMAALTDVLDMKTYRNYMKRDPLLWGDGCDLYEQLRLEGQNNE